MIAGERETFGPFVLTRSLPPSRHGQRSLAVREGDHSSHVVHALDLQRDRVARFQRAAELLAANPLPHATAVQHFDAQPSGRCRLVTAHVGSHEGLLTLHQFVSAKGGRLAAFEVARAAEHLLQAVQAAHAIGLHHGPLVSDEILIDPRGSVSVELYGLSRLLDLPADQPLRRDDDTAMAELRSVAAIAFELLTGSAAPARGVFLHDLRGIEDHALARWLGRGLDPVEGFRSAHDALATLRHPDDHAAAQSRNGDHRRPTVVTTLRSFLRGLSPG